MRNFFIIILAGFFSGVFFRSFFDFGFEFAALFIFLGAILGFLFWRFSFSNFILFTAAFLAAFALGALRYEIQAAVPSLTPGEVRLSGTIIDDPQKLDKFTRAVFETERAKILLTLQHFPEVNYGDKLTIEGRLEEPKN